METPCSHVYTVPPGRRRAKLDRAAGSRSCVVSHQSHDPDHVGESSESWPPAAAARPGGPAVPGLGVRLGVRAASARGAGAQAAGRGGPGPPSLSRGPPGTRTPGREPESARPGPERRPAGRLGLRRDGAGAGGPRPGNALSASRRAGLPAEAAAGRRGWHWAGCHLSTTVLSPGPGYRRRDQYKLVTYVRVLEESLS
jgi:hypothetical protein